MAGCVAKCKGCGKDQYDEQTYGMRERGMLCHSCVGMVGALNEAIERFEDRISSDEVSDKSDTLEALAENINRHEAVKAQYRSMLGRLTHRELLKYTVSLLDGQELYEAEALVSVTPKTIRTIISKR